MGLRERGWQRETGTPPREAPVSHCAPQAEDSVFQPSHTYKPAPKSLSAEQPQLLRMNNFVPRGVMGNARARQRAEGHERA